MINTFISVNNVTRYEVFTAVKVQVRFFWVVMLCRPRLYFNVLICLKKEGTVVIGRVHNGGLWY